ncbi:DUF4127 family protein [Clostridium sp.]|uniref:DUF4127 family protein n=1 Tax=Clostridium sp. TaxID=1506 RepID=UPI003F2A7B81
MKKIIYIPLDERPCNLLYPQYMSEVRDDIKLIAPGYDILGDKKNSADINKIWEFIYENIEDTDILVMSMEMVMYGGLLPSRIHYLNEDHKENILNKIKKLKQINKNLKIYASNLIMRTPKYNSSDEEPDYYENYGERIFKRAYLKDKKERTGLNNEEEQLLNNICLELPKEHIDDYENRRRFNININKDIINMVKCSHIDFLSIPQDDSAEFGYTAIDQSTIYKHIRENRLQRKVNMYPGADEVGASLVARAINDIENRKPKIYPLYSSTLGPTLIPLYEDRIMNESLKSHIMVTGSEITNNEEEADIILAINSPGKIMQESWDQFDKDITYTSFRNLLCFVEQIQNYINKGKKVIICDSAFANGGDLELITLLDEFDVLDKLMSYKGWNTNCNSLGTTLAQGIICLGCNINEDIVKKNLIYHILEDALYQPIVRMDITHNILDEFNANYFDLNNKEKEINEIMNEKLKLAYNEYILNTFKEVKDIEISTFSPWRRMFEIGIDLKVKF